ncbi:hypothetical protein ACVU7I_08145, partial [Patulibacter sp. S7RM1-6]
WRRLRERGEAPTGGPTVLVLTGHGAKEAAPPADASGTVAGDLGLVAPGAVEDASRRLEEASDG